MSGKLVYVSGRDPLRTSGGSESYAMGQARAAMLAGYEPHLFSLTPKSEVLQTDYGFLHRVRSPVRPPRSITSVLQRPWLVPAITRFLEGEPGPHIVHSFGAWADCGVTACRQLERKGVHAVPLATVFMVIAHETRSKLASTVVRESPVWKPLHRLELAWVRTVTAPIEARAYRRMPAVLVNYRSVERALVEHYGPGMSIRHITYSPPTALEDPPTDSALPAPLRGFGDPQAPLIVSVSRHDGRKGIDVLIGALAALRDAGVAFRACLVGPGLLLTAHRRLISRLALEGRVLIPGRVPAVTPYLMNCDIYVLPSVQEGSGALAVLEALQTGAAIAASAIDGIPEDLTDGHDSLLFAPGDQDDLARTLTRLMNDSGLRARLSAQARATYERRFAAPVLARALTDLYTEFGLPPRVRNPA